MNATLHTARLVLLCLIFSLAAVAQTADDSQETITFTKDFPGSVPEYISITLRRDGRALYRMAPDEEPTSFEVSAKSTDQIFALVSQMNDFQGAMLESKRKVAAMGKKTFLFQNGEDQSEASFNHTEDADALALTDLFEKLAATQLHLNRIEYLLRFDKLGIVKELLQVEMDLDQGRLLDPILLLPALERVRANASLVQMAQTRATGIIHKIQTNAD